MERFPGSPIEAEWVARQKTSCDELTVVNGELWFIQSDPDLAGAKRLMHCRPGGKPVAVGPADLQLGSWLHAYGGGTYAVSDAGVWFVSEEDSALYLLDRASGGCRRMAPLGDGHVYGDLRVSPRGVLAVRELASVGDQIVEVTSDGQVRVLVESLGFLAAPTVLSGKLAYVAWDADQMPWDASQLCLTSYDALVATGTEMIVAGGLDESIAEPQWGPDGGLYFLSDRTGWWNLYRWQPDGIRQVLSVDQDCCPAPWEGGYRSFAFLARGAVVVTLHDGFRVRLVEVAADGQMRHVDTNMTSIKPYLAAVDQQLGVIGSNSSHSPAVRSLRPSRHRSEPDFHDADMDTSRGYATSTVIVSETVVEDRTVRFLLRRAPGTDCSSAPLLVRAHPGPTDDVPLRLDWTAEFFVSRGFAVADVAYRGSSGQGRSFRRSLYGHWGEYDVQDCVAVAEHLLAHGVARPGAVFISGASAGGYTALQAARSSGPFTAATATSAITDPNSWATTAPRFQRQYATMLAGPAGAVRAKDIAIPVLLIHGSNDQVAPAADAQLLADDLRACGKEHEALFLDGGGHYLSDPRSRQAALQAEADFYARFIEPETWGSAALRPEAGCERTR